MSFFQIFNYIYIYINLPWIPDTLHGQACLKRSVANPKATLTNIDEENARRRCFSMQPSSFI